MENRVEYYAGMHKFFQLKLDLFFIYLSNSIYCNNLALQNTEQQENKNSKTTLTSVSYGYLYIRISITTHNFLY